MILFICGASPCRCIEKLDIATGMVDDILYTFSTSICVVMHDFRIQPPLQTVLFSCTLAFYIIISFVGRTCNMSQGHVMLKMCEEAVRAWGVRSVPNMVVGTRLYCNVALDAPLQT